MEERNKQQPVYRPYTLNELLVLADEIPQAYIYAGGIELLSKKSRWQDLFNNSRFIYIGEIEELSRISRTEKYLEIGAAVTISKMLNIGKNIIGSVLYNALLATGTPSIRNLATIGGNICAASAYSTILPVLYAVDTRVEIRSIRKSYWLPLSRFILNSGKNILQEGDVLTRIRIPSEEWPYQCYKKITGRKTQRIASLVFCAIAETSKNVLSDIRLVYGALGPKILRNREFELKLAGRKLPLSEKEVNAFALELNNLLARVTSDYPSSVYKRETSVRLTRWFLDELNSL